MQTLINLSIAVGLIGGFTGVVIACIAWPPLFFIIVVCGLIYGTSHLVEAARDGSL